MNEQLPPAGDVVIRNLLERNAAEAPDETFVTFEDGSSWTREQALHEVYAAANILRSRGVGQGDRVALFLPNGPDVLRAWWGVSALGATIVPINLAYKGTMLRQALERTAPVALVTLEALRPALDDAGLDLQPVLAEELCGSEVTAPVLDRPIEPWDMHSIIFTSGTTGPSKASLTSHHQVFLTGSWCCVDWGLDADDVFLIDLPLFHNAAQSMVVASLATRTRLAIRSAPAMQAYWSTAKSTGATVGFLLSSMVGFLMAQPEDPGDRDHALRLMIASPLPADCPSFQKRFGVQEIITAYGSTESAGPIVRLPGTPITPGYCGLVRPGFEVRLVDEHDVEVPVGAVGELIVRADLPWSQSSGYLDDPASTAASLRNGWFHTGDQMRRDADGSYFFHDRLKDAVRRRGENISSFEVEREVLAHPAIAEVACVAVAGAPGDEDEVKVLLVARPGAELDLPELVAFLADRAPHFMVPRYYEVVAALPKTETMKVQKHLLRESGVGPGTWDCQAHGLRVTRDGLVRTS